ncbi:MAG: cation-transporting P-type ATPase, partial [Candidatus Magasanikbacteria bacterium]|nr:cation-transporting P-type ATPase [Candidatus Magasanikbacteria bacterium]
MNTEILERIFALKTKYKGLSSQEYQIALEKYGLNLRPAKKKKGVIKRMWDILSEPMILLLFLAALTYLFLGDHVDTVILLISIIPILIIEFIQERRTDKAIEALDKIVIDFCRVFRDEKIQKIEIKNLVPGDLVYLSAGDKTPADGILINSVGLLVDESMLTGESVVVSKSTADSIQNIADENKLFQGTLIAQGEGYLLVTDTGAHTAYGKLGNLLEKIERLDTPLQKNIRKLVKGVAIIAISLSFLVGVLIALKTTWINGLLGSTTLAMALIPEEFPIVFSVFLIMGVWRMTKQKALVREMAMVETLGSATVICTDKTGTLTEGKMSLEEIFYQNKSYIKKDFENNKETLKQLMKIILLSMEEIAADPMEVEVQRFAASLGIDYNEHFQGHTLLETHPFESKSKTLHHLFQNSQNTSIQYSAGAPESIIAFCNLPDQQKDEINKKYEDLAQQGYRVIAVAQKNLGTKKTIEKNDLEFVSLLAMSDPPRANVKEAIDTCQKAGIRVIMITGDNHFTAKNIALAIGLKHNDAIIKGSELENITPEQLAEIVKNHDIFSRVKPEQKFEIVDALQKQGEVVAMTGDGVNDAPALKKA